MVLDSAIALALEDVDFVLVGSEAVVENGGLINRLGTYTTSLCAKALNGCASAQLGKVFVEYR